MKAIVWHGRGDVRFEDMPTASVPKQGEVRVRVGFCGICGTDWEEFRSGPIFIPVESPHPLTHMQAPVILGHEFSGVVDSVGPGVETLTVGDHVAAETLFYCGKCANCRRHLFNLCQFSGALGLAAHGGLSALVTAPAELFLTAPERVPLDELALAEPLAVAVRAVRHLDPGEGDRTLVMGAGPVGLLVMQVLRTKGTLVDVVEPQPSRVQLAAQLGAGQVFTPLSFSETTTADYDGAVDCTGVPEAQLTALNALRSQGRLVLVGVSTVLTPINTMDILQTERQVVGSLSHVIDTDFAAALDLLTRQEIRVRPLISTCLSLRQAAALFQNGTNPLPLDVVKILVDPNILDDEEGVPGPGEATLRC